MYTISAVQEMTITVEAYRCRRCGHVWRARRPGIPIRCAKCKSPYWRTSRSRTVDFTKVPAFGIWSDRPESDEELLKELGTGWGRRGDAD